MRGSVRLGKVWGIPLEVHTSWLVIFVLVSVSLAQLFGERFPFWSVGQRWGVAVLTSLLLFASVLVHELAHSVVAVWRGIPVRGITLFIFGGVSHIAREASTPGVELLIAVVGPLLSLTLGVLFSLLAFAFREGNSMVYAVSSYLGYANLVLGVFNLVPGFPLDGGRVLRAAVWRASGNYHRATRVAATTGQAIGILFIVLGILLALFVSGALISGLWLVLIGWFLESAAATSYRQLRLREVLQGYVARDLMTSDCATVSPDVSIQEMVEQRVLVSGARCFLVTEADRTYGLVTIHSVREVPRTRWAETPVRQVMTPTEHLVTVSPNDEAYHLMEVMDQANVNQVPVVQDGNIIGLVTREGVIHFLRVREELGI
ncbi:MAG: site-2 protease family protein [Chloroflexi bacterium]|nr:site-2 protease family protein [Chloroflexota bacterium]